MKCATKEELQKNCAGAWDAYRSAVGDPDPVASPETKSCLPPYYRGLAKLGYKTEAFLGAVHLLGEHQKASRALSRHLSEHRC